MAQKSGVVRHNRELACHKSRFVHHILCESPFQFEGDIYARVSGENRQHMAVSGFGALRSRELPGESGEFLGNL